jgi:hypothetical protein
MGLINMVQAMVSDDVANLGEEIKRMRAIHATTTAEIGRLEASRLQQDSFEAAESLDREIKKCRWTIDRIANELPDLERRHDLAVSKARAKRWRDIHAAYLKKSELMVVHAIAVQKEFEGVIALISEAMSQGFNRELGALARPPHLNGNLICAPDLLQRFKVSLTGNAKLVQPAAAMTPAAMTAGKARARLAHEPRPTVSDANHAIQLGQSQRPRAAKAARPADDLEPLLPSETRVKVLNAGWPPADDKQPCHRGQIVRTRTEIAVRAELNGAVEILERYNASLAVEQTPEAPLHALADNRVSGDADVKDGAQ